MLIDKLKIRNSFTSQAIAGKQCNLLKNVAISVTSTNIPFFGLTLQLYFRSWALLFCCQSQIITPVTPPISPVHPLPSHYFPAYIHGLQFSKQYCKYQRPLFVDNVFFFYNLLCLRHTTLLFFMVQIFPALLVCSCFYFF